MKQNRWDLDKRKFEHAQECISEVTDIIRIADSSDHKQEHDTLLTLLLVLVTHGRPHWGTVCLLPFKGRIIPFEASELSPQKVHSQEPASPVDHSVIPGRTVLTSLGSSLPQAQLQSEGTGTAKS